MESRAAFRGEAIGLSAVFAVIVVLGLAVLAVFAVMSVSAPGATQTTTYAGPGSSEPGDEFDGSGYGLIP